ncbi:MAG: proton-conducting transporter membrane subunit [bacterium]|nr:proton-conducting transporter membrane subunit [bacterium]
MSTTMIAMGIIASVVGVALAGLTAIVGRGLRSHRIAQVILAMSTAIGATVSVAFLVARHAPLAVWSFPSLYGMTFVLYPLGAVFFALVSTVACAASIYAIRYVADHAAAYRIPHLNAATAVFVLGMQGVLLAHSVIAFMLAWEAMSIAAFFLIMADRAEQSIRAALTYVVVTHLGAAAILSGFFILSGGNAFVDYATLVARAAGRSPTQLLVAATLFLIGFGSKAGLVPLHGWLPEAHPQAPSHISALMSGAMLKVAVYGFMLTMTLLPPLPGGFGIAVLAVGLCSGIAGALGAAVNRDIKQTLAWSSIEHLGIIFSMLGLSLFASAHGLAALAGIAAAAALFHCVAHALFKSGLFLTAGAVVHATHTRSLEGMGGIARRMPMTSVAFLILVLSAAALPPFGAFYSEWTFLRGIVGTLHAADPLVLAVLVVTLCASACIGGIGIFAMIKLFAIASLGQPRSDGALHAVEAPRLLRYPILALAAGMLAAGAWATALFRLLGADAIAPTAARGNLVAAGGTISPGVVLGILLGALALAAVAGRIASGRMRFRSAPTWDCGQPITAAMEYTATAFGAPMRFFFRSIIQHHKVIASTPVVATNAYIRTRSMTLASRMLSMTYIQQPVVNLLLWKSAQLRRLQNGAIQFYLILIFIALTATLVLAV